MTENKGLDLALAYLKTHPGEVAHLLEQQPVQDAASFLDGIPSKGGASVLSRMIPQYAAQLCGHMNPETCAALLNQMEASQVAAVLRHAKGSSKTAISKLLTERLKLACQVLLGYSQNTVGAWMTPGVSGLPVDCTVEEALTRVREDTDFYDLDCLYVVDRGGILVGKLNCRQLLNTAGETGISALMDKVTRVVQGRSTLEAALQLTGWRSRDAMPVVNRKKQLVGVVRLTVIRRALAQNNPPAAVRRNDGIFFQVCGIYGQCLIALFNTFGSPRRPINP